MNLKKILEYQKKDAELIKLERKLSQDENKKIYTQMVGIVKDTQNKSSSLEKQASDLIASYENLKKTYSENLNYANKVNGKNVENSSVSDLEALEQIAQTILNNMSILEKKMLALAEKVNTILVDFDQAKKKYNMARDKYNKHKALYEESIKSLKPEIEQAQSEVKKLESGIDSNILSKYKQRRSDNIFPVLVPCMDKCCGGCRMELPSASLSTLKTNGILECEHCRRIIYSLD